MPVMDEFREERAALRHGTPKEKLSYFWYYYKWHTIGGIFLLCVIISIAHHYLTLKEDALYVAMLNCADLDMGEGAEQLVQGYADYADIDLDEYEITINTNLYIGTGGDETDTVTAVYGQTDTAAMEKVMVSIAAGEMDIMMGGGEPFAHYANGITFGDMRAMLSEEQVSRYEPYFYYVDMAFVRRMDEMASRLEDTSNLEIPDPRKPELMAEPTPVAIYIDGDRLSDFFYFRNASDGLALGVIANASHLENVQSFIDFLMQ